VTEYVHSLTVGSLTLNFEDETILASSDVSVLEGPDLLDAIEAAGDSTHGRTFPIIAATSGRQNQVADGSRKSPIAIELNGSWTVGSVKTSGEFQIIDVVILRADAEDFLDVNPLCAYKYLAPERGTIVTVSSGSGLSTEEHDAVIQTAARVDDTVSSRAAASALSALSSAVSTIGTTLDAAAARVQRFAEENGHEPGSVVTNVSSLAGGVLTTLRRVNGALRTTLETTDPGGGDESVTVTPEA
jgi:hypothetical protein